MGTMCTVTENNRLLSDFIGWKLDEEFESYMVPINFIVNGDFKEWAPTKHVDDIGYYILTDSQMEFHRDWNWLMEVVERIESLGVNFWTVKNKVKLTIVGELAKKLNDSLYDTEFEGYDFEYYIEGTKIEAVYQAVVEFIKWYNN